MATPCFFLHPCRKLLATPSLRFQKGTKEYAPMSVWVERIKTRRMSPSSWFADISASLRDICSSFFVARQVYTERACVCVCVRACVRVCELIIAYNVVIFFPVSPCPCLGQLFFVVSVVCCCLDGGSNSAERNTRRHARVHWWSYTSCKTWSSLTWANVLRSTVVTTRLSMNDTVTFSQYTNVDSSVTWNAGL